MRNLITPPSPKRTSTEATPTSQGPTGTQATFLKCYSEVMRDHKCATPMTANVLVAPKQLQISFTEPFRIAAFIMLLTFLMLNRGKKLGLNVGQAQGRKTIIFSNNELVLFPVASVLLKMSFWLLITKPL